MVRRIVSVPRRAAMLLAAASSATLGFTMPALAQTAGETIDLPTVEVRSGEAGEGAEATPAAGGAGKVAKPTTAAPDAVPATAWGPVEGYIATVSAAGTKTPTPILETPRAISVITRDQMDDRAVQTVAEALEYSAGVLAGTFGYDPRFDEIVIRGFDVTERGDYRDGLRQASGNFAYFRTEPDTLERIDVIKGPAGVLYGESQPGGIVDRISKMPVNKTFADLELQAGNYNTFEGMFDAGTAVKDGTVMFRFTGLVRDADTQIDGAPDNVLVLAPSFTWKPDADTTFTVLANYNDTLLPSNTAYYQSPALGLTTIPATPGNFNALDQQQAQLGYRFEHRFDETWTVRQNLRYGHIDLDAYYLDYSGVEDGPLLERYATNYNETLNTVSMDNQVQAEFATGAVQHTALFGLDYIWADFDTGIGYGDGPPLDLLDPNAVVNPVRPALTDFSANTSRQLGLYAQDQMKFGQWRFNLGGRNDWVTRDRDETYAEDIDASVSDSRDDGAFSGQAGLLYLFDNGVAPYASVSTSFQPSNYVDELGHFLEPSTAQQFEAGIKYQPVGGRSFITASAYQISESNFALPDSTGLVYIPVGDTRVRGLELEGLWEIVSGFNITAAYTYMDAVITSSGDEATVGNAVPFRPTNTASLWANYTYQDGDLAGLGFGAGVRYIGENYGNVRNDYQNPAQTLLDGNIHFDRDNWRLALNATNILDTKYALQSDDYFYWSAGRTVLATARISW